MELAAGATLLVETSTTFPFCADQKYSGSPSMVVTSGTRSPSKSLPELSEKNSFPMVSPAEAVTVTRPGSLAPSTRAAKFF